MVPFDSFTSGAVVSLYKCVQYFNINNIIPYITICSNQVSTRQRLRAQTQYGSYY